MNTRPIGPIIPLAITIKLASKRAMGAPMPPAPCPMPMPAPRPRPRPRPKTDRVTLIVLHVAFALSRGSTPCSRFDAHGLRLARQATTHARRLHPAAHAKHPFTHICVRALIMARSLWRRRARRRACCYHCDHCHHLRELTDLFGTFSQINARH